MKFWASGKGTVSLQLAEGDENRPIVLAVGSIEEDVPRWRVALSSDMAKRIGDYLLRLAAETAKVEAPPIA